MGISRKKRARVRCWSCGKSADRKADYCYGCGHIVCLACVDKYHHYLDGRHGRKRPRSKC
jgi:rRNA maturation endonuclease Nob1